jgi:hypothetical protein
MTASEGHRQTALLIPSRRLLRSRSDLALSACGQGQSRRALIRVSSVLARGNNRAISLAVLGKRVDATTWNAVASGS